MRKIRLYSLLFFVLFSLSLFCGCTEDATTTQGDREIKQLAYSETEYCIDDNCILRSNLTGTGEFTNGRYLSVEIISDYIRYSQLISGIRESVVLSSKEGQYLIRIGNSWDSVPDNFPKKLSLFHGIDEALFEEYDLLMVDLLIPDTIQLEAEPQSIQLSNGCITVNMEYTIIVTSTSDNCGLLYFFCIPKGCTSAEVQLTKNEANSISQAGPGF